MINFNLQNHKPLREIVYEELKRQIMVGEILPGTRMMEVELADEMGVSRTPVREAIRKMEKEGLVNRIVDESDLRKTHVFLTDKGKQTTEALNKSIDRINDDFVKGLSAEEKDFFIKTLENIKNGLK